VFVGDQFKYQLPNVTNPEKNDEVEVSVTALGEQEFPGFVSYMSEFHLI